MCTSWSTKPAWGQRGERIWRPAAECVGSQVVEHVRVEVHVVAGGQWCEHVARGRLDAAAEATLAGGPPRGQLQHVAVALGRASPTRRSTAGAAAEVQYPRNPGRRAPGGVRGEESTRASIPALNWLANGVVAIRDSHCWPCLALPERRRVAGPEHVDQFLGSPVARRHARSTAAGPPRSSRRPVRPEISVGRTDWSAAGRAGRRRPVGDCDVHRPLVQPKAPRSPGTGRCRPSSQVNRSNSVTTAVSRSLAYMPSTMATRSPGCWIRTARTLTADLRRHGTYLGRRRFLSGFRILSGAAIPVFSRREARGRWSVGRVSFAPPVRLAPPRRPGRRRAVRRSAPRAARDRPPGLAAAGAALHRPARAARDGPAGAKTHSPH